MESYRYADESNGYHDGFALTPDHSFAQDDERSRNKEGNGANATIDECQQPSESSIRSMFLSFINVPFKSNSSIKYVWTKLFLNSTLNQFIFTLISLANNAF